jgi:uncharacterized protein (DUF58 family)
MIPSPALLTSLSRSRLLVRRAKATIGIGERRSPHKGAGMEFADHRRYQPGDDLRHLDTHLHRRTGEHYVRQYEVHRQLPVTIIVDGSASMIFGTPTKFEFACSLASALAFVGLAGGDAVDVAVHAGARLQWCPRVRGVARAHEIFHWLDGQVPAGAGFGHALTDNLPRIVHQGLLVLISDWWLDDPETELKMLGSLPQETLMVHVATPEELDPSPAIVGETRLIDVENGHEIELLIDRSVLDAYKAAFARWQGELRRQIVGRAGRYLVVRSDSNLSRLLLHDWRRLGLIH